MNTSTTNPVDLGFYGFDFHIMAHTIEAMAEDDNVDTIIPYFSLDFITSFQNDQIESGPHAIVEACRKINKPVIPILSQFTENILDVEDVRIKITATFRNAGLGRVYRPPGCHRLHRRIPEMAVAVDRGLWYGMSCPRAHTAPGRDKRAASEIPGDGSRRLRKRIRGIARRARS